MPFPLDRILKLVLPTRNVTAGFVIPFGRVPLSTSRPPCGNGCFPISTNWTASAFES